MLKTKAIMLLSYVINETENDMINTSEANLTFIIKILKSCVTSKNHFSIRNGYWAVEIVAGESYIIIHVVVSVLGNLEQSLQNLFADL